MSDALSFAEIDGQRVELLPTRTLLGAPDWLGGGEALGGAGGPGNLEGSNLGAGAKQVISLESAGGNAVGGLTGYEGVGR